MADFLDSLNEQQRRAACYEGGGVLVLAGAGTGKTRVLTSRIAWLIAHCNCSPRDVLAVTFTNKAAKEMQTRVGTLTPFRAGDLALGTFHGICHRMLRRHAEAAGWEKNFQILDSQDQKSFIRRLLTDAEIDTEEFQPADCAGYINRCKETGLRASDAPTESERLSAMREIYALYEEACKRENKLDFAELLLSSIDLLSNKEELRQHYAARFCHVLIDEFQDTNPLQYRWLKLLDSGDSVFFAVGDDDQSIYAFRGADPKNMRRIQHDLRVGEIIRLEQNYRSTGNILSAANRLIKTNSERLGKNLFTNDSDGAPVKVYEATSDFAEASGIASAISGQINDNIPPAEIAVLYRANAQSRLLEKAMMERGLPYRIYGGTRFFDRMEIKHALAYLRLAVVNDTDALMRVINTPPRGIGKQTITALMSGGDVFAGVEESTAPKVTAFRAVLQQLRALRADSSLVEMARAAVEASGLLAYYESRAQERERAENLREFVSAAEQFTPDDKEEEPLLAFLANAALESGEGTGTAGEAVNLMTVHAAKGLEFSHVHVAGMEEGMFPHSLSLDSPNPNDLEEERRLMYVAVTRARKELFLYCAHRRMMYGNIKTHPRSRFVDELQLSGANSSSGSHTSNYHSPKYTSPKHKQRPPSPPPQSDGSYRPGDVVRHAKYGNGVIVRCEGRGEELTVEIAFKRIGIKRFLAAKARLERVR